MHRYIICKLLPVFFILVLAVSSSGCWDRREPELLGHVLAVAFDYDPETEKYHVIAQMANPLLQGEEGEGGEGGEGKAFWVISADGRSPFEAMRNLAEGSSRELFWAHNTVTLFSEELAMHGLQPVLDLFERERQLRLIAHPLVVEGDLRTLMEAEYPLEESGARGLQRQVITIGEERGLLPTKFMTELYNTLEQPGIELFIGRAKVLSDEEEGNEDAGNSGQENNQGESNAMQVPPAKIGGAATFKGDRMVGWVEPDHTVGWNHVMGRVIRDTHLIESPEDEEVLLGIEVIDEKSSMRPVVEGEEVRVEIRLWSEAIIQEYPGQQDLDVEDEFTRALAQRTAEALRHHIEEHITRSQELNSDVLGLGNLFYRKKPRIWQEIEDDWEEIFPELEVDIYVEVKIRRTGLVSTPVREGGR